MTLGKARILGTSHLDFRMPAAWSTPVLHRVSGDNVS